MMNMNTGIIVFIGVVLNLSACSVNQTKHSDNTALQKLNTLREQFSEDRSMTYGVAVGRTPDEAVQNARTDLANQILTLVQKKTSSEVTVNLSDKGMTKNRKVQSTQKSQSVSFSTVELENTQIIKQTSDGKGHYYAVVGADQKTIEKIKEKARQTASTLVVIEQLKQAGSIAQKIKLLEKGLQEMARHGVADDTVLIDGERYTFGAYFDKTLNTILKEMEVAVTKDNEVYDVYLLESGSLNPITGVKVQVNKGIGFTDSFGKLIVPELERTNHIYLLLNSKPYLLNTFVKGSSHSVVYINTRPKGFLAELKQDYKVVASVTTPEKIPLDGVKPSSRFEIKLHGNEQYPSISQRINLTPGFDYVYFKQFEKLTFGKVDLALEEEDNELTLTSAKGETIYKGQKGYHNDQLPVGSYDVEVQREDHDPEYQIVEDEFLLKKDQRVKRKYLEPKYREYYRKGSVLSLGFIAGGSPNESAEYTSTSGSFSGAKTGKDLSLNLTSFGFGFNYKYYLTNLYFGGGLGLVSASDNSSNSSSSSSLTGYPVEAVIGGYTDFDEGKYIGVEAGYRKLSLSPGSSSYLDVETDISSPFVGVDLKFGSFQLGIKYFTAGNSTVGFFIGMSGDGISEGYRLPERVKAIKGVHYIEE